MTTTNRHISWPFLGPPLAAIGSFWQTLSERLRRRPDSEAEQAVIRVVLGTVACVYMLSADHSGSGRLGERMITWDAVVFLIGAAVILVAVLRSEKASPVRRCAGIVLDMSATSVAVAFGGEASAPLMAVYLWVIIGNGFRYGDRYLAFAVAAALIGLIAAIAYSPFWGQHVLFSASLVLVLVLIPAYMAALLRKLRSAMRKADEASLAKSQFLAKMSHELRTPLNGVIGVADLLQVSQLGAQERELVSTIQASSAALLGLIDGILDFSRIEAGHIEIALEPFDIEDLVANTLAMLRHEAEAKGLDLAQAIDPRIPRLLIGDFPHTRQILLNLVGNAVKFTDQGRVHVAVSLAAHQAEATRIRLRFDVTDTGRGIALDEQPRIFDSFHQAAPSLENNPQGIGLGAAIAQELVQRMGGQIGVLSAIGEGSTFWFELPFGTVEAKSIEARLETPQSRALGTGSGDNVISFAEYYRSVSSQQNARLRILVAEDNETNRRILKAILEQAGHQLTLVSDGEAALDALTESDFDLMILDKGMPNRSGLEVFKAHRFMRPSASIPTIILSADATETAIKTCLDAGVDAYLTKPVASYKLLSTVARVSRNIAGGAPRTLNASGRGDDSGATTAPLLDWQKLHELRRLASGSDEVSFLKELVEDFRRDAQNAVSSVADALGSNDYPALRAALHALEGSSRELGALGILRSVKQLKQIKPFELGSSRAQLKLEQLRSAVTTTSQLLSGYAAQTGEERAL